MSSRTSAELKKADTPATSSDAPTDQPPGKDKRRRRTASAPDDVSRVLRGVYDDTVREPVPDDFMDLLGKLS